MPLKIIVGLGNPGKKYSENRHNIGFKVIDRLASDYHIKFKRNIRLKSWVSEFKTASGRFLLVKPKTYMNNSGFCLDRVLFRYKTGLKDLLIIYDDADLNFGTLRIKKSGSAGGHRGMESIIDILGTKEINRLKIGVGKSAERDLADYVLSDFSRGEKDKLKEILDKAAEVSLDWFKEKEEKTIRIG
ncbi:MAG: aminoacyl-tRNA hydrolase [Candidatus Omnitrophica bacterium]|nr:aminoacyl-tRNA hydrolase [Candidatus Omnitrophota bacterium]MCF7878518.1 aminoacyl-tRNA hydrolase [Candidatus Omnitrophota bacterium]